MKATAIAKSGGAIDFAVRCNPIVRRLILQKLQQFCDSSRVDLGDLRDEMTARTLTAARSTRYGAVRGDNFSIWPILSKEAIRKAPQDFVNRLLLMKIPAATGGTTGVPLKLWRSLESIVAEQVFLDDLLKPHGLGMHESRVAVLRADTVKSSDDWRPPYGRLSHGGKRLTLSSRHLNAETFASFYKELSDFEPSVLWVYPSAAMNLLSLFRNANLHWTVPVILASSEELSATLHVALAEQFSSKVINYYGQAERVCFAYSTRPNEFFFHPAYGRVELCNRRPDFGDGQLRIVATSYWNLAMPLVRYDTGDLAELPSPSNQNDIDEISVGRRAFTGLAGREGEFLLTSAGMRIIGLNQIPREIPNILRIQLVQFDFETLIVYVVAAPGFAKKDAATLADQARAKLPSDMKVQVQIVRQLTATANGKTPYVIRTVGSTVKSPPSP